MAYADEVLADNPYAYYKLDEAAAPYVDTTGISSNLVQTATLQTQQPGPPVGGFSVRSRPAVDGGGFLSGTLDSGIEISSGAELMVEIWIKWEHTLTVGGSEVFAFILPSTQNFAVWFKTDSGPPQRAFLGFNTWNNDAFGVNALRGDLMDNWAMLNLAFKSDNRAACRLWINAVEQTNLSEMDGNVEGTGNDFDLDFYIGAGAGPAFAFSGYLAHCSIYDTWLSQTRIDAHYAWAQSASKQSILFPRRSYVGF